MAKKKQAKSAAPKKKAVKQLKKPTPKASAQKAPAKKAPAKAGAPKGKSKPAAKPAVKQAPLEKARSAAKQPTPKRPAKASAKPPAARTARSGKTTPPPTVKPPKAHKLSARDLTAFRKQLLALRERVTGEISFLSSDHLNKSMRDSSGDLSSYSLHMADQGTDAFDREFALHLVSSESELLYEIDEALRRMEDGIFGICELSGEPLEIERLKAIPYARNSLKAQQELEGKHRRPRSFDKEFFGR